MTTARIAAQAMARDILVARTDVCCTIRCSRLDDIRAKRRFWLPAPLATLHCGAEKKVIARSERAAAVVWARDIA
jgi:hypothetical protein